MAAGVWPIYGKLENRREIIEGVATTQLPLLLLLILLPANTCVLAVPCVCTELHACMCVGECVRVRASMPQINVRCACV